MAQGMWHRECGTGSGDRVPVQSLGDKVYCPGTGSGDGVWETRSMLIRYGDIFVIQRKLNKNAWKRASTGIPSKSGMAFSKGHLVIRHLL